MIFVVTLFGISKYFAVILYTFITKKKKKGNNKYCLNYQKRKGKELFPNLSIDHLE